MRDLIHSGLLDIKPTLWHPFRYNASRPDALNIILTVSHGLYLMKKLYSNVSKTSSHTDLYNVFSTTLMSLLLPLEELKPIASTLAQRLDTLQIDYAIMDRAAALQPPSTF